MVATDVRALAQRSAAAAKEIKTLISTSTQQVDQGVKLVGETGSALGRIVEQVARLSRYGGDCYAYCMLAAGHVDLVIECGLKPYDVIPLIPIIGGAGNRNQGFVTDCRRQTPVGRHQRYDSNGRSAGGRRPEWRRQIIFLTSAESSG